MKKIVCTLFLLGILNSCRVDKGTFVVTNNSDYNIEFVVLEQFSTENNKVYTVPSHQKKSIDYVGKRSYFVNAPHNLVNCLYNGDFITISDINESNFHKVIISNFLPCGITLIDNNQNLLADSDKNYIKDELSFSKKSENQVFFVLNDITKENVIIKTEGNISKIDGEYFFDDGVQKRKINIDFKTVELPQKEYKIIIY